MNGFYFFIPFILIVTVGLSQDALSATIEHGPNYDKQLVGVNPDGSQKYLWTSHPQRIQNDSGEWVDQIVRETTSSIIVESFQTSFVFDKVTGTVSIFEPGKIMNDDLPVLTSESWVVKQTPQGLDEWNDITWKDDTPSYNLIQNGTGVFIDSIKSDVNGYTKVTYAKPNGLPMETFTEIFNNNPNWNNHKFGYDQSVQRGIGTTFEHLDSLDIIEFTTPKGNKLILDYTKAKHEYWGLNVNGNELNLDYKNQNEVLGVGQKKILDPTFGYTTGTIYTATASSSTSSSCPSPSSITSDGKIKAGENDSSNSCARSSYEWDISSIDDSASITDVTVRFDITGANLDPRVCDWTSMETQPSTLSVSSLWNDIGDGTVFIDNDTTCQTSPTTNLTLDLGSSADDDLEANVQSAVDWWAFGIKFDNEVRDADNHQTFLTDMELQVVYELPPKPDAVDDLTSTDITDTTVDLSWSQPNLNTGNLSGYQVNYSTPWTNNPNTVITNNTETSDTTTQITGLTEQTQYSFRIGVWTEYSNMSGNVVNVTTLEDFALANFTPGFFDVNATNDDIIQIFFERQNINDTALFLNVTYPNTYDLACDFEYTFANINQTYRNLDNNTISANAVESSFLFTGVDNEIIDVYCWDEGNLANDGSYLITQTSFPLLEQIANFRAGEYGTDGDFGAIDFITLAVVIISMIGFNRVNESVGAVFNIILLGSLAYFEFIELPTIIFGAIAVTLILVVSSTRKV